MDSFYDLFWDWETNPTETKEDSIEEKQTNNANDKNGTDIDTANEQISNAANIDIEIMDLIFDSIETNPTRMFGTDIDTSNAANTDTDIIDLNFDLFETIQTEAKERDSIEENQKNEGNWTDIDTGRVEKEQINNAAKTNIEEKQMNYEETENDKVIENATGEGQRIVLKACKRFAKNENRCRLCNECFSDSYKLEKHKCSLEGDNNIYGCDICSKTFNRPDRLYRHKKYHKIFYRCEICYEKFETSFYLQRHMDEKRHFNKKQLHCNVCNAKSHKYVAHKNMYHENDISTPNPPAFDVNHKQSELPTKKRKLEHLLENGNRSPPCETTRKKPCLEEETLLSANKCHEKAPSNCTEADVPNKPISNNLESLMTSFVYDGEPLSLSQDWFESFDSVM